MHIQYDPTAAVYELFDADGEWLGAYDTYAEASAARSVA
jgi:hypothetical protein